MSHFKEFVDVLEVAVRIERKGLELYKRLYDTLQSPEAKGAFAVLAAEEERHAGTFRTMLGKIADYTPRYDYPGEYGMFLNEYAASILEKAEKSYAQLDPADFNAALDMGIMLEKETILFYLEIKEEGFGKENAEVLQQIINEERSHWKKLLALKKAVKL